LTGLLGAGPRRERWENLIAFMSGSRPSGLPVAEHGRPGTHKILALVFEGPGAAAKICAVLGPTDPAKAPPGTIRKEFGTSMMVNAAHASDSPENTTREIGIDNLLKGFVESAGGAA
jgi:Nucleoside diphosphate kinase